LLAVYCEGWEESLPAAARGVQGDQADWRAWMGLSGKKDAILLFNFTVYFDICLHDRLYMCETSLMLRQKVYPILVLKLP
jgi:hypothetical protein